MAFRNKLISLQKWVPIISFLEPQNTTNGFPWIKSTETKKISHKIWNPRACNIWQQNDAFKTP